MPLITKESGDIGKKVNHINPAFWQRSVEVKPINLHACWLLGCQKAVQLVPEADQSLLQLSEVGFDMLSLFGTLLVNQHNLNDEYDCLELESEYLISCIVDGEHDVGTTHMISNSTENSTCNLLNGDIEDAQYFTVPHLFQSDSLDSRESRWIPVDSKHKITI